jgi:hypothetical protein
VRVGRVRHVPAQHSMYFNALFRIRFRSDPVFYLNLYEIFLDRIRTKIERIRNTGFLTTKKYY